MHWKKGAWFWLNVGSLSLFLCCLSAALDSGVTRSSELRNRCSVSSSLDGENGPLPLTRKRRGQWIWHCAGFPLTLKATCTEIIQNCFSILPDSALRLTLLLLLLLLLLMMMMMMMMMGVYVGGGRVYLSVCCACEYVCTCLSV